MMNKKRAQRVLIAHACCASTKLSCCDCPLLEEDGRCRPWTDEELVEAVRSLKEADGNA